MNGIQAVSSAAVAAIRYAPGAHIESFMASLAERLQCEGIAVAGLLQRGLRSHPDDRCSFEMRDLAGNQTYRISQALGTASTACAVDQTAIAAASVAIRCALESGADVVLVNKFGALEAAGGGLREEMNQVFASGLILLTSVAEEYLAGWRAYAGGEHCELPMDMEAVARWVIAQRGCRR